MHGLGMHEAMAARLAAALQTQHFALDHAVAVQHHQPVHRAHERIIVIAPAHRLWYRQRAQAFRDDLRQQHRHRLPRCGRAMHEALALVVAGALQLRPLHAGFLREAQQRACGLALRVQRDVDVRPEGFGLLLALRRCDMRHIHRQPARCAERAGVFGIRRDAALAQTIAHAAREGLREFVHRVDRQLFATDFDQQRPQRFSHSRAPLFQAGAKFSRRSIPPLPAPAHARAGCSADALSR